MNCEKSPRQAEENRRATIVDPPPQKGPERYKRIGKSDLLLLLIPCLTPVLLLVTRNPVGLPHVERLFGAAGILWLVVVGVCLLLVRLGTHKQSTIFTAFLGTYLFMSGDGLVDRFDYPLGATLAGATLVITGGIVFRLRDSSLPKILIYGIAAALVAGPIIQALDTLPRLAPSTLKDSAPLGVQLERRPDIFLIVVDGHPGMLAIDQDFGEGTSDALKRRLGAEGFVTLDSVWASYWATDYSLPSLLEMDYPTASISTNAATKQELYKIIAGDNRLVSTLERIGYMSYMVESGWSGSSCGDRIDRCVSSPWLDESMFLLFSKSMLNELILERFGYAFTAGSVATMNWLLDEGQSVEEDGKPSFVFAHLMTPHPPFFLDSNCELAYEEARTGVTFQLPNTEAEHREAYLQGQMECVERFMIRLARLIDDQTILVFLSDHGTDRRNQLIRDPSDWRDDDIVERMNAFAAIRGDIGCDLAQPIILPNVMAELLTCLGADGIDLVDTRMHLGPEVMLVREDFEQFVGRVDSSS